MQVRAIREALAVALGYRVYDTLPESGQLPLAAVSWPDEIVYHRTLSDGVELSLSVTVVVALTDFALAQKAIDDVMSTPGLGTTLEQFTAVEGFSTLPWYSLLCESASNVRQVDVGAPGLAVDLNISIIA